MTMGTGTGTGETGERTLFQAETGTGTFSALPGNALSDFPLQRGRHRSGDKKSGTDTLTRQ